MSVPFESDAGDVAAVQITIKRFDEPRHGVQGAFALAEDYAPVWSADWPPPYQSKDMPVRVEKKEEEANDKEAAFNELRATLLGDGAVFARDLTEKNGSKAFVVVASVGAATPVVVPPELRNATSSGTSFYEIVRSPVRGYIDVDIGVKDVMDIVEETERERAQQRFADRDVLERDVIKCTVTRVNLALQRAGEAERASVRVRQVATMESNQYAADGSFVKVSVHFVLIVLDDDGKEYLWASNIAFAQAAGIMRVLKGDEEFDVSRHDAIFGDECARSMYLGKCGDCVMDATVYTHERNLRLYSCTKKGKARPFRNARLYAVDASGDIESMEELRDTTRDERVRILALTMATHTSSVVGGLLYGDAPPTTQQRIGVKRKRVRAVTAVVIPPLPAAAFDITTESTNARVMLAREALQRIVQERCTTTERRFKAWTTRGISFAHWAVNVYTDNGAVAKIINEATEHDADDAGDVDGDDDGDGDSDGDGDGVRHKFPAWNTADIHDVDEARRLLIWAAMMADKDESFKYMAQFVADLEAYVIHWRRTTAMSDEQLVELAQRVISQELEATAATVSKCSVIMRCNLTEVHNWRHLVQMQYVESAWPDGFAYYTRDAVLERLHEMTRDGVRMLIELAKNEARTIAQNHSLPRTFDSMLALVRGELDAMRQQQKKNTVAPQSPEDLDAKRSVDTIDAQFVARAPPCVRRIMRLEDIKDKERWMYAVFCATIGDVQRDAAERYAQSQFTAKRSQMRDIMHALKGAYDEGTTHAANFHHCETIASSSLCPFVGKAVVHDTVDIEDLAGVDGAEKGCRCWAARRPRVSGSPLMDKSWSAGKYIDACKK